MPHRADDDTSPSPFDRTSSTHSLKIVREVPLWGMLGVIAGIGGLGVSMYYGQQSQASNIAALTIEVRALTKASQQADIDRVSTKYEFEALKARVGDIERRHGDLERRVK
jgi:hypothetical protein